MNDLLIFALLFAAIAIGWWLGRRGAGRVVSSPELPGQYYKGLNYILEDHPDGAIDAFINALEVNSETLETHIALGNLLRKKGEVERAIRIHQNLLPTLRMKLRSWLTSRQVAPWACNSSSSISCPSMSRWFVGSSSR